MVGRRLASYEILSRVARGGMGVVYRARHVYIDRIVALKVLDPGLAERKDLIERFRTEAQSLARVEHENVIKVIDILEEKGVHFIVMDFAEGVNLRVLVKEKGPLPPAEMLSVARQSADALYAAHKQGILHRDIKPENLILSSRGRCKLTDFGLAGDLRLIAEGHEGPLNFGTPAYAAPEVLRRMTPDVRSDIFSWGATMYHLATGEPPFGATGSQQIQLRQKQGAELLEARRPDLPRSLCALIQDAMAFHPAERPADFREVLERMPKRVHATTSDAASATTGLLTSTVPTTSHFEVSRWAGIIGGVIAVGALVTLAVVLWLRHGGESSPANENTAANLTPNTANAPNAPVAANRPVANTSANTPRNPTFTPEEDAFNAAELDSREALSRADFKRAWDSWSDFIAAFPQSSFAAKARAARDEVQRRVVDRRDLEFKSAETASNKALADSRTADALAYWEKFPPELLVPLYPGENDAFLARIEAHKKAINAREASDLAALLERAGKLRDADRLLDERALLDTFLSGRTTQTQETVRARLKALRQLLEARHQAALELVETRRKAVGPLRAEAARKVAAGIEAMALDIANRRFAKVTDGVRVLGSDVKDALVAKLLEDYARDVSLAAKAERALPDAVEKLQRRGGEHEFKVHAAMADDGTRSGTLETFNGRVTTLKQGEFTITESSGGVRTIKYALLHASTVRSLLKEGSIDERAALVAWLFSQNRTVDARAELARLLKLAGVTDALALQLGQIDASGALGGLPLRLLRYFAARENDELARAFLAQYDPNLPESRLLAAALAFKANDDGARSYLDAAAAVTERDLICPKTYARAASSNGARTDELRRWVEIESWQPPGKSAREPYNPEALLRLAQRLEAEGALPEARRVAAQALALDASNEAAWQMVK